MPAPLSNGLSAPIPILLMVRQLDLGGSERQLAETVKSLDRSQFTPHVGCFHPEGLRGDELRALGVPIVKLPVRSFYAPGTLAVARQLVRYIRRHQIALVHTFDVPSTLFGVPSARASRDPIVVSSQRAHRSLTPGLVHRRLLRLTDRMVDAVVVNCEAMRRHLVDEEGVSPRLVHLCPNGIDGTTFQSNRTRSQHSQDDAIVIGTVCALRPEKAVEHLLDGFATVRRLHPLIRLVIVGNGPSLNALQARAEALGLKSDCQFESAVADVARRLRDIDIFVLPSMSEALSNALMEAMACGCAVVATDVGGNPELVTHGRTGLLVEGGNVDALAAALRRLIEQPSLRTTVGAAASCFIRENFSLSAAAERLAIVYSTLLSVRRVDRRRPWRAA